MNTIRILDCAFSMLCLLVLSPLLLGIAIAIKLTSRGPVFFRQVRVGKDGVDFNLYKFRTMKAGAEEKGLLTVGGKDSRITGIGYLLRKYKLDELPQLVNVLKGEMSVVGPRPEVKRYVDMYSLEQRKVLAVLPGITDYASIAYRNENELLANAANPEEYYIREVMPRKIELNHNFISNRSLKEYFSIIFRTLIISIKNN